MTFDLALIWAGIIGFAVAMYILMDGFDLGIGILFPFARSEAERDIMMNTVAPVWDGNETWLVLGGGGLLAAFPLAYAIIMPALYFPMLIMLVALIFRGVAFEFRFKSQHRTLWGRAFFAGSLVATFAQGLVLGGFLQGFKVEGRNFAGGAFDWLTPFGLGCGVALVVGYALLGATWLILKTEGELQARAYRQALPLWMAMAGLIVVFCIWAPLSYPAIRARWFTLPDFFFLLPIPLLTAAVAAALFLALKRRRESQPFLLTLVLLLLTYLGFGVNLWPYVAPPSITLWEAATARSSQLFLLVGVVVLLPAILFYTGYSYFVFRGKVTADAGYHH
ncbi:MAG: cytochrome d ubiquinol oxidase, subunit [Moraxellaceae bacterium]|jgi:cytochrome d ubiquinol oxidase subunit II|nr:cytochrome d ubiquinol oxidase, subunit [Moraxellaceae bacterium]